MELNKLFEEIAASNEEDERFEKACIYFNRVRPTKGLLPQPMKMLEDFMKQMPFEEAFTKIRKSKGYGGGRFELDGTHFAISGLEDDKGTLLSFNSQKSIRDYMFRLFYTLGGTEEDLLS